MPQVQKGKRNAHVNMLSVVKEMLNQLSISHRQRIFTAVFSSSQVPVLSFKHKLYLINGGLESTFECDIKAYRFLRSLRM